MADAFPDSRKQFFIVFQIHKPSRNDIGTAANLSGFGINERDDHKHAVLGEHLAVADDDTADIADAQAVYHDVVHHGGFFVKPPRVFCDVDDIAIVRQDAVFFWNADFLGELGVGD